VFSIRVPFDFIDFAFALTDVIFGLGHELPIRRNLDVAGLDDFWRVRFSVLLVLGLDGMSIYGQLKGIFYRNQD